MTHFKAITDCRCRGNSVLPPSLFGICYKYCATFEHHKGPMVIRQSSIKTVPGWHAKQHVLANFLPLCNVTIVFTLVTCKVRKCRRNETEVDQIFSVFHYKTLTAPACLCQNLCCTMYSTQKLDLTQDFNVAFKGTTPWPLYACISHHAA